MIWVYAICGTVSLSFIFVAIRWLIGEGKKDEKISSLSIANAIQIQNLDQKNQYIKDIDSLDLNESKAKNEAQALFINHSSINDVVKVLDSIDPNSISVASSDQAHSTI